MAGQKLSQRQIVAKIEASERVIYSATKRFYEPDPRFEFRYDTTEELLKKASLPTGYLGKISELF